MDKIKFTLTKEYIELIKLLKLLNVVESGAQAKLVVEEGLVKVNNAVEHRKRRKLKKGDSCIFQTTEITID